MNPCEVTVHAQEKKIKKRKTWTQDSVESKQALSSSKSPSQKIKKYKYKNTENKKMKILSNILNH